MLCDGNSDCPDGEDEQSCDEFQCVGLLRCRGDGLCVHLYDVCDGVIHCLSSADDESLCQMSPCPPECICRGSAITCTQLPDVDNLSKSQGAIILDSFRALRKTTFSYFYNLVYLKMTNSRFIGNSIEPFLFTALSEITTLIIRDCGVQFIKTNSFVSMRKLTLIDLHKNTIHEIHSHCFTGLQSMLNLDLSNLHIKELRVLSFFGMTNRL